MATVAPDLHIPPLSSTVSVSIIDTTARIRGVPPTHFMEPKIEGHDYLGAPAFSFLVQNTQLDRTLVFDLGVRKDWWNSSPTLNSMVKNGGFQLDVEKSVREILEEGGVDCTKIEAVVWSHWHFDHTGNPAEFEKSTALIVGPGFKEHMLPAYPAKADSTFLESDYAGRDLIELDLTSSGLKIGRMEALDYFGDGSLYFLNTPGHAVGHVCALARVTAEPPSFVLMGGDAYHHCGEIRPSPYLPLPDEITPHPLTPLTSSSCPGSLFESLLRNGDKTQPFAVPTAASGVHADASEATRSIEKLQEADVRSDILMVAAHDETLLDIVDFFPQKADDFVRKGWVAKARWRFLMDYAKAVGYEDHVEGKRDWSSSLTAETQE